MIKNSFRLLMASSFAVLCAWFSASSPALAASPLRFQANKILDPEAMVVLKKNRDEMLSLKGYRAQCRMVTHQSIGSSSDDGVYNFSIFTAGKPNLMRYDSWECDSALAEGSVPAGVPESTVVSNGKKLWKQSDGEYEVEDTVDPADLDTEVEPWDGFFVGENSLYEQVQSEKEIASVRYLGKEDVEGVSCDKVVVVANDESDGVEATIRRVIFFRPDGLARRQVMTTEAMGVSIVMTAEVTHIEKDPDLRQQAYVYVAPKGVGLRKGSGGLSMARRLDSVR